MAAHRAALSWTRPIAGRCVHLQITPRPENLAQSREILRWISQFGPVDYYKNLKYDRLSNPTAALVIFRDQDAARRVHKRSPIRLTMEIDEGGYAQQNQAETPEGYDEAQMKFKDHEQEDDVDMAARAFLQQAPKPSAPDTPKVHQDQDNPIPRSYRATTKLPGDRIGPAPAPRTRHFQIQVNESTYNHRDHINVNPYHGNFSVDSKSAVQEDLAKSVPLIGLSDINLKKVEKPWRVMAWQKAREESTRRPLRMMYEEGLTKKGILQKEEVSAQMQNTQQGALDDLRAATRKATQDVQEETGAEHTVGSVGRAP